MNENIKYTKEYFKLYCEKNKKIFDKINFLEERNKILNSSFTSLERYDIFHYYLIDNKYINKKICILDLGCYIGFYVNFLNKIGIKSYGVDYSERSILFGNKIGIQNIIYGDITNLSAIDQFYNKKFDFISCLHVFEYIYFLKNGEDFIYKTLLSGYSHLKKGGKIFFSTGDGYKEFDKKQNKIISKKSENNIDINKIIEIGYSSYEIILGGYYVFIK